MLALFVQISQQAGLLTVRRVLFTPAIRFMLTCLMVRGGRLFPQRLPIRSGQGCIEIGQRLLLGRIGLIDLCLCDLACLHRISRGQAGGFLCPPGLLDESLLGVELLTALIERLPRCECRLLCGIVCLQALLGGCL